MSKLTRTGRSNPSRETKFSGANGGKELSIFPVQLTTSRIGNLTRLIHTLLLYVMTLTSKHILYCLHSYIVDTLEVRTGIICVLKPTAKKQNHITTK